jgi:hypothetical protein
MNKLGRLLTVFIIQGISLGDVQAKDSEVEELQNESYPLQKIAETQLKPKEKYKVYEICSEIIESVNKEDINYLVDAYYNTHNSVIKSQIRTLLAELRGNIVIDSYKALYNDPRLIEEDEHQLFFSTVPVLLLEDRKKDLKAIFRFLSKNKIADTVYPPTWFNNLHDTKHLELIYEIVDLESESSDSLLAFMLSLGVMANMDSKENERRIVNIREAASKLEKSDAAQGILRSLGYIYEDMKAIGEVRNKGGFEAQGVLVPPSWEKQFTEKALMWDAHLNRPNRLKLRKGGRMRDELEREIALAKSYFLSDKDNREFEGGDTSFTQIKDYLNRIREAKEKTLLNDVPDIEGEAGKKIISLGTFDFEDYEGEGIVWGPKIENGLQNQRNVDSP